MSRMENPQKFLQENSNAPQNSKTVLDIHRIITHKDPQNFDPYPGRGRGLISEVWSVLDFFVNFSGVTNVRLRVRNVVNFRVMRFAD